MKMDALALPQAFCWTRFGPEAGQTFENILERKERERRANGGVFFWGIGNAVGQSIAQLVKLVPEPEVLFSPIRGRPRPKDVAPAVTLRWTEAQSADGSVFPLPPAVLVKSGRDSLNSARAHYALVCFSSLPLETDVHGVLPFGAMRNLRSGSPLGASQVTAVVSLESSPNHAGPDYIVALRARLVAPYIVTLRGPVADTPHVWVAGVGRPALGSNVRPQDTIT